MAMSCDLQHPVSHPTVPGPNVTISADPAAEGLMLGSTVTLTCAATLNPHVNTDLHLDDSSEEAVEIFWVDPLGELIRDENITVYRTEAGLLVHSSDYVVSDVGSFDEGVYECTVRVQGGPHLVGATVTEDISVSLSGKKSSQQHNIACNFKLSACRSQHCMFSMHKSCFFSHSSPTS
jgi:hypothetical protein